MGGDYLIKEVRYRGESDSGFSRFYLDLEDPAGNPISDAYLQQKPETKHPEPGGTLYGNVEEGEYGPRFRKEQRQGNFRGGGQRSSSSGSASSPLRKSPDDLDRRIVRQHSQEMALRFLTLQGVGSPPSLEDLKPVIDWFDADAYSTAIATPQPTTPTKDVVAEAKADLVAFAKENEIPLPMVATAVSQVTGQTNLVPETVGQVPQVKEAALGLKAEPAAEIPF